MAWRLERVDAPQQEEPWTVRPGGLLSGQLLPSVCLQPPAGTRLPPLPCQSSRRHNWKVQRIGRGRRAVLAFPSPRPPPCPPRPAPLADQRSLEFTADHRAGRGALGRPRHGGRKIWKPGGSLITRPAAAGAMAPQRAPGTVSGFFSCQSFPEKKTNSGCGVTAGAGPCGHHLEQSASPTLRRARRARPGANPPAFHCV